MSNCLFQGLYFLKHSRVYSISFQSLTHLIIPDLSIFSFFFTLKGMLRNISVMLAVGFLGSMLCWNSGLFSTKTQFIKIVSFLGNLGQATSLADLLQKAILIRIILKYQLTIFKFLHTDIATIVKHSSKI